MRGGGGGGGGRGKWRRFGAVRSARQLYRLSDHRPVIRAAGGGGGGRVWWPSHPPSSSPRGARAGGEGGAVSWAQRGGGMKRQQSPRRRPFLFSPPGKEAAAAFLASSTPPREHPKIFPPGPSYHTDTDDRPHRQLRAGAFTGNAPVTRVRQRQDGGSRAIGLDQVVADEWIPLGRTVVCGGRRSFLACAQGRCEEDATQNTVQYVCTSPNCISKRSSVSERESTQYT